MKTNIAFGLALLLLGATNAHADGNTSDNCVAPNILREVAGVDGLIENYMQAKTLIKCPPIPGACQYVTDPPTPQHHQFVCLTPNGNAIVQSRW